MLLSVKNNSNNLTQGIIYDAVGQEMQRFNFSNSTQVNTAKLEAGIYHVLFRRNERSTALKFIVTD
jgi:hypothetical protein